MSCAQCGTPIVDPATLVRESGGTFCCTNCLAASQGRPGSTLVCAHCATPIVDVDSEFERDNRIFCCPNCAQVDAGIGPARTER
jgi:hypothetical protein